MLRSHTMALSTVVATALLAAPAAWGQGDLSADSPLANDSPLVELLLSQDWSRAEMSARLLQALEVAAFQPDECVPGGEMFDDVPASSPFCKWIEELVRRGLTTGCGDDIFCPNDPVNRQQMAVFLVRAIEAAVEEVQALPPTGPAGGDLAGSYPDPSIVAGAVTTAKLAGELLDRITAIEAAAPRWAVIGAQGSFLRDKGVADSERLGLGSYRVLFEDASSELCGGTVSVGRSVSSGAFAYLIVESSGNPDWFVEIRDSAGNPVDRPFQIQVTC